MATAPPPSACAALAIAAGTLTGRRASVGGQIPPARLRQAIAGIGSGPDHFVGEAAVALVDEQVDKNAFGHGVLLTDRRFVARGQRIVADLPYDALQNVATSTGALIDDLHVTAWGRLFILDDLPEVQALASFVTAMLRVHASQRIPPPSPLPAATLEDPTAGLAARSQLVSGDVRVLPLLGMAIEGHRQAWFPAEVAADHVTRAALYDRALARGRGVHGGWWTSPLGPGDLAYAFARLLGAPHRGYHEGHARVLEHRLTSRGNAAGAAASTAVGLAALGLFGVGWVSRPGQTSVDVTLKLAAGNASTGFTLSQGADPLSKESGRLVASLFDGLARIEGRLLLLRAAFGWDLGSAELDAIPAETVFHRVAQAIGPLEIRIFYPPA
jgi:hypothetical protein